MPSLLFRAFQIAHIHTSTWMEVSAFFLEEIDQVSLPNIRIRY